MAALIGVNFNSCKKDDFSEKDAMNLQAQLDKQKTLTSDSIEKAKQLYSDNLAASKTKVTYTISLVDAANTTMLKSASAVSGIAGASIVLTQNGKVITKTTDANGFAVFDSLKIGHAALNIKLANYSEVNATVNLNYFGTGYAGGQQLGNVVPMIAISGTSTGVIKGKVIAETDLTNFSPEVVANAQVIAKVRTNSSALNSISNQGIFQSISYGNLSLTGITDVNGNFSLTVPATSMGLDYDITVSDFTTTQKLLQNTYNNKDTSGYVVSIPTNFGSTFTSPSSLSSGTPVIVTIGAPDYTYTQATATAVIANNNGIGYIQNTNVGSYYYDGPTFTTTIDNPATQTGGTKATVTFSATNGHVSGSITTAGSKYPSNFDASSISIPYVRVLAKAVVDVVNGTGAITSYHVNAAKAGEFFSTVNLQFSKQTGNGIGIITEIPGVNYSGSFMYFTSIAKVLSSPLGSGYAVGDSLVVGVNSSSDVYTGKIFMTTGTLTAINITNEGSNYVGGQVDVIISSPANGTTANAIANVTIGKISSITFTPGNGYSVAPTVTIINKIEKIQAKYTANFNPISGVITGFNSVNQGNGYVAIPMVTITSAIPGAGTGALASAIVNGNKVTSVVLVNGGKGFQGNIPAASQGFSGSVFATDVVSGGTSIININLGTGKRTIEQ